MYMIHTSDGHTHLRSYASQVSTLLDHFGPEVVSVENLGSQEPSRPQLDAFSGAIQLFAPTEAVLVGSMDEDGTLLMQVTEDGATTSSRWCRDGRMLGSWF